MEIKYHGQSCFEIKGKAITIVTDPYDKSIGLNLPKLKAHTVLSSHPHFDHNNIEAVEKMDPESNSFVINSPGGYEVRGALIEGFNSFHDNKQGAERGLNTIFEMSIDGIVICHLGDLGHTLSDELLEDLNSVDILLVPVGGKYTVDAETAAKIVGEIEPRMVIPMHYKVDGLNLDIDGVDNFIKEMGMEAERLDSLKIDKKDLPSEGMRLVVLNNS